MSAESEKAKELRKWADAKIKGAVVKGAREGLHHGDIQDLTRAALERHLTHEDIQTYDKTLAKTGYSPPSGFKPGRPAAPRPQVDDKAKGQADQLHHEATRKANRALTAIDAGGGRALDSHVTDALLKSAADDWDVAADKYEELGLKAQAGTARQRAKYARSGDAKSLRYYAHGL